LESRLMDATFRQIQVFETAARHLSFSRAARELHMTQPGVSTHLRQLERHIGLPLFEQVGKKIFLTSAGLEMLRYSRAIIQQLKETDTVFAELKAIHRGLLNVAVISAGDYFFPGLLAEFCRRHEGVTVRLTVNNRDEIVHQLLENTTDISVLLRPPDSADIVAVGFAPQPHLIVAPPNHPLAGRKRIPIEALAEESFIVRERGSDTRQAMDEMLAERGMKFRIAMEIRSTETIKQAVIAGMGVSFLSTHTVGDELDLGRLIVLDVEGFPVMRKWHIVHHKSKRLPPVATAFKEFLIQEGASQIIRLVGRHGHDSDTCEESS
jgi:LysR family transcriptional regulator, low CO2-responsive transcriptional regulator